MLQRLYALVGQAIRPPRAARAQTGEPPPHCRQRDIEPAERDIGECAGQLRQLPRVTARGERQDAEEQGDGNDLDA